MREVGVVMLQIAYSPSTLSHLLASHAVVMASERCLLAPSGEVHSARSGSPRQRRVLVISILHLAETQRPRARVLRQEVSLSSEFVAVIRR